MPHRDPGGLYNLSGFQEPIFRIPWSADLLKRFLGFLRSRVPTKQLKFWSCKRSTTIRSFLGSMLDSRACCEQMTFAAKTLRELHAACKYQQLEVKLIVSPDTHLEIGPVFKVAPP